MKTLRYMGHAMGLLLRSAMQYRASFLMQTLSQAVMTGGDLLAVAVLLIVLVVLLIRKLVKKARHRTA